LQVLPLDLVLPVDLFVVPKEHCLHFSEFGAPLA
jgi:hypothetical protein